MGLSTRAGQWGLSPLSNARAWEPHRERPRGTRANPVVDPGRLTTSDLASMPRRPLGTGGPTGSQAASPRKGRVRLGRAPARCPPASGPTARTRIPGGHDQAGETVGQLRDHRRDGFDPVWHDTPLRDLVARDFKPLGHRRAGEVLARPATTPSETVHTLAWRGKSGGVSGTPARPLPPGDPLVRSASFVPPAPVTNSLPVRHDRRRNGRVEGTDGPGRVRRVEHGGAGDKATRPHRGRQGGCLGVDTAVNLECDFESLPFSLGPRLDHFGTVSRMNDWFPKPGWTVMISNRSIRWRYGAAAS